MMQIWPADRPPLTPAEIEFATTTPNAPGHAEFMERARKRYPTLPPGAQQAALFAYEVHGPKAAARYASHARARWPKLAFQFVIPSQNYRGPKFTPKQRRELAERLARYRAHMRAAEPMRIAA